MLVTDSVASQKAFDLLGIYMIGNSVNNKENIYLFFFSLLTPVQVILDLLEL
jgi:hypothetical protein